MIATWKREALAGIKRGFSGGGAGERAEIKRLQAKVGELVSDNRTIRFELNQSQLSGDNI